MRQVYLNCVTMTCFEIHRLPYLILSSTSSIFQDTARVRNISKLYFGFDKLRKGLMRR